jgi:general stress protein 26
VYGLKDIDYPYNKLKAEFIEDFKKLGSEGLYERAVLSTSKDDIVTARRMRFVPDGLTLYCYTDQHTRKQEQIEANPNVAVVVGYTQIEGTAKIMGNPLEEQNADFIRAFKENNLEFAQNYMKHFERPDRSIQLIKIEPKRIALFKYGDPEAGIERGLYVLDVPNKKAHRFLGFYDIKKDHKDAPAYVQ